MLKFQKFPSHTSNVELPDVCYLIGMNVPDEVVTITAQRERDERESDLDLLLCHANPFCQLYTLIQAWVHGFIKIFLQ